MHEFASVQEAIRRIRKMKPLPKAVKIRLGKMRGSAKGFEDMFREHSRDTDIKNIRLEIENVPVEIRCTCGLEGTVRIMDHVHFVRCPKCGRVADILRGNELDIEVIE